MSMSSNGPKVWCDSVLETAIGKTKGTFDPVDNNQATVKIQKPEAASILGLLVNYNPTIVTDAENTPDLILQITSKALGISAEEFVIAHGGADGDAATPWSPRITKFLPFRTDRPEKLFNAELGFKVAPSVTNTAGVDVAVGVMYSNAEPDMDLGIELMAQMHKRATGGDVQADAAKAHGTGFGAVTLTALDIPTGPTQLLGILAKINPNAITASKPIGGVMELSASGIPDFSPQIWPLCTFWSPVLGTVISNGAFSGEGRYYPTRFPLTGAAVTVTVQSTLIIAASDAPDTTQAVLYE